MSDLSSDTAIAEEVAQRLDGKRLWTFCASETVFYEFKCYAKDEEDAYTQYGDADLDDACVVDRTDFQTHEVYREGDE